MKHVITALVWALIVGCSARPTAQEVFLRDDGTTVVSGVLMTDSQLRDQARAKYRKQGPFVVTVRADAKVPLWRLEHVADIYRAVGLYKIDTGSADPNTPALLYPTFNTWTNEWEWNGVVAGNPMAAIKTNVVVNVRLLSDGAQIEGIPAAMQGITQHLASLSGGDRARVVITADTNAPHSSLLAVLMVCEKKGMDALFVEHWQAAPATSPLGKR